VVEMKRLVLIKIGGSAITDIMKESVAKPEVIRRLAGEIKRAAATTQIVLGHGSGSFGHVIGDRYKVHEGLINDKSVEGAALTQDIAAQLNRIVVKEFCAAGINAISFPPSAGAISKNRRIFEWNINPLEAALKHGLLPVTYGDVVADDELGVTIVSTEEALRYIAEKLKPEKVILGADIDGVFTANPKIVKDAKLIKEINGENIDEALKGAGISTKIDVTGGMKSKLQYSYEMAKSCNTVCQIVNIGVPGRLYSAIIGEEVPCTTIRA
jgi:isopentenyl phosphate kinase